RGPVGHLPLGGGVFRGPARAAVGGAPGLGIQVALGAGGAPANMGFEILVPYTLIGTGVGDCNEIKLFATTVKGSGTVTNQSLPPVGPVWAGDDPDYNAIDGRQYASVFRALNADVNADGSVDVEDLYALNTAPTDINDDGTPDVGDLRTLTKRVRTGEVFDAVR
ncbi:MAG: hypothetical protein AAGH64_01010, partial [Planctomycetota bacterium]